MHAEQNYHFPAVCFWKDLISDAVKNWFSLTSVKALIFLLGLNIKTFQTRFFGFLGFHKIFINDLTLSPHCHVFVNAFLLPPTYGCCWCFSKSLELGISLWLQEVQWWWSWKLTRHATFPLITFIICGKSWKIKLSPEPVGRIAKTSWPWLTRFKQIFCSSQKDLTYRKCLIVLFVVALMSTSFDNRCPSPSISHSSSMSPVLEC